MFDTQHACKEEEAALTQTARRRPFPFSCLSMLCARAVASRLFSDARAVDVGKSKRQTDVWTRATPSADNDDSRGIFANMATLLFQLRMPGKAAEASKATEGPRKRLRVRSEQLSGGLDETRQTAGSEAEAASSAANSAPTPRKRRVGSHSDYGRNQFT